MKTISQFKQVEDRNPIITELYATKSVLVGNGTKRTLVDCIDEEEGAFIHDLISSDASVLKTLEVGCAYGLSSLHICEATKDRPDAWHCILDPFQEDQWAGVGLANLHRAGFNAFEHLALRSEFALPKLLAERGEGAFDLIFINGWHTFDHTLIDCFYSTRLLRTGGYLVIDDADIAPVARAIGYFCLYPCYRRFKELAKPKPRTLRRLLAVALFSCVPARVRGRVFHCDLMRRVFQPSTVRMIALRKEDEDLRSWNWYQPSF